MGRKALTKKTKVLNLLSKGKAVAWTTLRNKFGANSYITNTMLAEIFLAKYPVYSCSIKKLENHISQKSCGCC